MLVLPISQYVHPDVSTLWGELFKLPGLLEVIDSRNSNNQNDSNNNTPTMIIVCYLIPKAERL